MDTMLIATITEIPQQLEPTTEDPFVCVAITETTAHRIAELFGAERERAIVD
jgi:hypothetical protein